MSDNKRSLKDVQDDYTRVCARLGHVEYNISIMKKDAEAIKGELQNLNVEASKLNAASVAEQPAPEAAPQPEASSAA